MQKERDVRAERRVSLAITKFAAVCCVLSAIAVAQEAVSTALNPATVPTDLSNRTWWAARHKAVVEAAKASPDTQLLLIGDSITNNYDKPNLLMKISCPHGRSSTGRERR